MKIADLYARTPEKMSKDPRMLRGFYYNHVPELGDFHFNLPKLAHRMTIHIYKEFEFDARRFWRLAAVFLDNRPVMVIQNAGREGDDHAARFITDVVAYNELVHYLASLMHPDPLEIPMAPIDVNVDIPGLDDFYGSSLDGYFERY